MRRAISRSYIISSSVNASSSKKCQIANCSGPISEKDPAHKYCTIHLGLQTLRAKDNILKDPGIAAISNVVKPNEISTITVPPAPTETNASTAQPSTAVQSAVPNASESLVTAAAAAVRAGSTTNSSVRTEIKSSSLSATPVSSASSYRRSISILKKVTQPSQSSVTKPATATVASTTSLQQNGISKPVSLSSTSTITPISTPTLTPIPAPPSGSPSEPLSSAVSTLDTSETLALKVPLVVDNGNSLAKTPIDLTTPEKPGEPSSVPKFRSKIPKLAQAIRRPIPIAGVAKGRAGAGLGKSLYSPSNAIARTLALQQQLKERQRLEAALDKRRDVHSESRPSSPSTERDEFRPKKLKKQGRHKKDSRGKSPVESPGKLSQTSASKIDRPLASASDLDVKKRRVLEDSGDEEYYDFGRLESSPSDATSLDKVVTTKPAPARSESPATVETEKPHESSRTPVKKKTRKRARSRTSRKNVGTPKTPKRKVASPAVDNSATAEGSQPQTDTDTKKRKRPPRDPVFTEVSALFQGVPLTSLLVPQRRASKAASAFLGGQTKVQVEPAASVLSKPQSNKRGRKLLHDDYLTGGQSVTVFDWYDYSLLVRAEAERLGYRSTSITKNGNEKKDSLSTSIAMDKS